jgi:hypothetical protein
VTSPTSSGRFGTSREGLRWTSKHHLDQRDSSLPSDVPLLTCGHPFLFPLLHIFLWTWVANKVPLSCHILRSSHPPAAINPPSTLSELSHQIQKSSVEKLDMETCKGYDERRLRRGNRQYEMHRSRICRLSPNTHAFPTLGRNLLPRQSLWALYAESLNSWLIQARDLPITPMIEAIRHKMMGLFEERRIPGLEVSPPAIFGGNV